MPDHSTEVSVYVQDSLILQQRLPAGAFLIGGDEQAHIRVRAEGVHARHALLFIGSETWDIESLTDDEISIGERAVGTRSTIAPGERVELGSASLSLHRLVGDQDSGAPADGMSAVRRLLPVEARGAKKFQVGHQVAEGGQGVIVDAHEITIQRTVAMKLMRDCGDVGMVARFIQEAQITAQLEHPNIVPVHELSVNELDQPYYTMKFVRGTSLGNVLAKLRRRDPETIQKYPLIALLTILQKVCDAVAFAHSRGVIHRDLKPDNVMLGEYGEALLMDWGLAKYLDRESQIDQWGDRQWRIGGDAADSGAGSEFLGGSTMVGTVIGTPQYMSPEQAGGEVVALGTSTDTYALGAILYHILTLEMPFGGSDSLEILAKVRAGEVLPFARGSQPQKLPHLPAGRIPESLAAVVRRAMSLQPEERYATVKDLQTDIEAYQSGFATVAEHAGAWKLFKLFLARHRTVSLAAALLLVAGMIFTGYTIKQRRIADRASREAIAAKKVADDQRDLAEEHLYRTHMLEAGRHIDEGRPTSADALLLQHRREISNRDLRGWEWYYHLAQLNRERLRVHAHRNGVFAIAVSADGSRIATAGGDGEIAIWESRGLAPVFRVAAHHGPAYAISFDKDGFYIASGGADGFVRVWDVAQRKQIAEARMDSGQAVRAVAWNPGLSGPPTLAVGGIDPNIYLWKPLAAGGGEKLTPCLSTEHGVLGLQWTPNGRSLIVGAVDARDSLVILDRLTGETHVVKPSLDSNIFAVAISPDGARFAAPSKHRSIGIFEMDGPSEARGLVRPGSHRGFVSALAWSPDSSRLISAGLDGTILVYAPEAGWQSRIMCSVSGEIHALAWARLGAADRSEEQSEAIISGGVDGTLRLWSTHPDSDVTFPDENWLAAAQWSPNGQVVAESTFLTPVKMLDLVSGQSFAIPTIRTGVHDLAWSPSGTMVATANRDLRGLELFASTDGHFLGRLPIPTPDRVSWSPTGKMIVGCGLGGARCWEVETARLLWEIPESIGSAAWINGAAQVALGGSDGSIKLYDAATGHWLKTWREPPPEPPGSLPSEHESPLQVFDLATSPDGRFLAYGTQDNHAGLLDVKDDGAEVQTFEGHSGGIRRIAWRPDGSRLATVGQDGTVRVYNPHDGSQVVEMDHGSGDSLIKSVVWDPSGDRMLTAGWDTRMRLWDASRGYLIDEVAALDSRLEQSPDDVELWRTLAKKCTQLGWPDRAREAFARIKTLAGDDAATAAQASEAEWIFTHAIEGRRLPVAGAGNQFQLSPETAGWLSAIWKYLQEGRMRAAVETWRQLARSKGVEKFLPLARLYFNNANRWSVSWFSSDKDPVSDLEGWREAAAKTQSVDLPMLCFPYRNRGPKALGLGASELEAPVFSMVATGQQMLTAGKWRCSVTGGDGCHVIVDGRTVLEHWTGTMENTVTADFEQDRDAEVKIRVESFLRRPAQHFDFMLEPLP